MKVVNGVWIGAIVVAAAAIVVFVLAENRDSDRPSGDQQVTAATDASKAAPNGGGSDPYKQDRAQAIDAVRNAYFAAGCKVFTSQDEVLPLVAQKVSDLNEEAKAQGITDAKLQEELNAAGQDGARQAQQSGACAYWEQHPNAALAVRRAVREAAEP